MVHFRPKDSERSRGEIERGTSVVTGSITPFNSVCHDAVATAHISFAVKLCVMQSKPGRKSLIEQPVGTRAWGTQLMNKLFFSRKALER